MMNWDNAIPMEDPRLAQLRSAALYAGEVHFDRKADYLVKGWLARFRSGLRGLWR